MNTPATHPANGYTLRVSVTDRCNFRCRYCAPPEGFPASSPRDLPGLDELASLVEWLAGILPLRKIRITGGEPLLRPRLTGFIRRLSNLNSLDEVTLTTNGSRLANLARPLRNAGLRRVNVSLDTLDHARFKALCDANLDRVLEGIETALNAGLAPVKLNAVLMRDSWRQDVPALLDYAQVMDIEIRFIELMQMGPAADWANGQKVSAPEVMSWLQDAGGLELLPHEKGVPSRPSQLQWRGKAMRVGWILPESHPFCYGCNRLRLDSRGNLRRCLMDSEVVSLRQILNQDGKPAVETVNKYLQNKNRPNQMKSGNSMPSVGG